MNTPMIIWFRRDLRLSDNPALHAAATQNRPIIPLYIAPPAMGGAQKWWLHHSLSALEKSLGTALVLRTGQPQQVLDQLVQETGATSIYWNRCYDPQDIARDREVKAHFVARGLDVQSFNGSLLWEPWEIQTQQNQPFKIFTPFWNACQTRGAPEPLRALPPFTAKSCVSETLASWDLLPTHPNWAATFEDHWTPGEQGAQDRLDAFLDEALASYTTARDLPAQRGTSRLSPHLHFGEISPRTVWQRITMQLGEHPQALAFLRQLAWREFSYHLLFNFPHMPTTPLRPAFEGFAWETSPVLLKTWQQGLTGYPIVDAGMRELWQTGWMHNRVRMIAASFLTKHLLLPWQLGAEWFMETLLDADLANNSAGWQWVAGSGTDAAPYFRIFNPILQGQKFDPDGDYVRRWIPELETVPTDKVHSPWTARIKTPYPAPCVDHTTARTRALARFYDTQNKKEDSL